MRYESHKRDLCFKCLWPSIFLYFLGGIRNSEDLEYIVTNRAGETVTTLINRQQRRSEYNVSGRNYTNQTLTLMQQEQIMVPQMLHLRVMSHHPFIKKLNQLFLVKTAVFGIP